MFAAVTSYTYNPSKAGEINQLVKVGVLPDLRRLPGFVAYYWMDSGAGTGASWIVFESKADADASLERACALLRMPLADYLSPAVCTQGQVMAFTNAGL